MHAQHGRHVRDELALRGGSVQLAGAAEPPVGVIGTIRKDKVEMVLEIERKRLEGFQRKG
jgi:hypothetical protein